MTDEPRHPVWTRLGRYGAVESWMTRTEIARTVEERSER